MMPQLPLPLGSLSPLVDLGARANLSRYFISVISFPGGAFLLSLMGSFSLVILSEMNTSVEELEKTDLARRNEKPSGKSTLESGYRCLMHGCRLEEAQRMANKIMIVDDDTGFRITLAEILRDEGWDVISAENGYQAIRLASEGGIALILMDVQMPGMNGVDAFIAIKKILPNCAVVIMTGHAVGLLIEKALSEGAMTVLTKPVSIEQLLGIVEEVVPASITS